MTEELKDRGGLGKHSKLLSQGARAEGTALVNRWMSG